MGQGAGKEPLEPRHRGVERGGREEGGARVPWRVRDGEVGRRLGLRGPWGRGCGLSPAGLPEGASEAAEGWEKRDHLAAAARSGWPLVPSGEGRSGPTRAARGRAKHEAIQEAKINEYLFLVLFIDSKSLC